MRFPTGRQVVLHHNKDCICFTDGLPCYVKLYECAKGEQLLAKR